jgi:hypothetical protein
MSHYIIYILIILEKYRLFCVVYYANESHTHNKRINYQKFKIMFALFND